MKPTVTIHFMGINFSAMNVDVVFACAGNRNRGPLAWGADALPTKLSIYDYYGQSN